MYVNQSIYPMNLDVLKPLVLEVLRCFLPVINFTFYESDKKLVHMSTLFSLQKRSHRIYILNILTGNLVYIKW